MSHLDDLLGPTSQLSISIPLDEGFFGRECPQADCESYFKVKPGTGLTGEDLPCVCPYCGHSDSNDNFWTKEQLEYAESVALSHITDAINRDLKQMEFEVKPSGAFGIGVSMKVKEGAPIPIQHYREKALETRVTCTKCTLEYAVYGVFAFCPDCGVHNSVQILQNNLSLVKRQLALAETLADADFKRHLIEDALENCVSAFDGFGRERCKAYAIKSTGPTKAATLSLQNLPRAADRLQRLWGIDIRKMVPQADWDFAHLSFMRRHLLAHCSGVIDQQYINESGDNLAIQGRRISIAAADVERLATIIASLGEQLAKELEALP